MFCFQKQLFAMSKVLEICLMLLLIACLKIGGVMCVSSAKLLGILPPTLIVGVLIYVYFYC
jgi:hypothetical protein